MRALEQTLALAGVDHVLLKSLDSAVGYWGGPAGYEQVSTVETYHGPKKKTLDTDRKKWVRSMSGWRGEGMQAVSEEARDSLWRGKLVDS